MTNGLLPRIGRLSSSANENQEAIYVFPDWLSLEDALSNWLGDEYEDETLSVLELTVPADWVKEDAIRWEATIDRKVPPENIKVLIDDIDQHDGRPPPGVVFEKQYPRDVDLWESVNDDKKMSEASWWLTRWISGSKNDPDWDDSWTTMDMDAAFELIGKEVGNKRSLAKKTLWRYISVPKRLANFIIKNKKLPPYTFHYQSFSGKRAEALDMAASKHRDGNVHLLVSMKPEKEFVVFGMADLLASKNPEIQDALMQLDNWHVQDEVLVRAAKPLPLLSATILTDIKHSGRNTVYENYETWREIYKDNSAVLATEDGSPPKFLYRVMSKNEYEIAKKTGYFRPRVGERIHASSEPQRRYMSGYDDVIVRFDYNEEDGWRPKWGDELYAITNKSIPFSRSHVIKDI